MAQPASVMTRDEQWAIHAIVRGHHHDPFSYLGMHQVADGVVVRAFLPHARDVTLIDLQGTPVAAFERVDPAGLFVAQLNGTKPFPYRLRVDDTEI
jgi:1,4-alpha-glucan branching enzyme